MIKSLLATFLIASSINLNTPKKTEPYRANETNINLYGSYNFKDEFISTGANIPTNSYEIIFEDISNNEFKKIVPYYQDYYYINWIYKISFDYDGSTCLTTFYCYHENGSTYYFSAEMENGDNIDAYLFNNSTYGKTTIFNLQESYIIHGDTAKVFNLIFTKDDNVYTTTYTGYYNFNNGLDDLLNYDFGTFGTITFNNKMYKYMYDKAFEYRGRVYFNGYSVEDNAYVDTYYVFPFNDNEIVSANMMLTGCKMSIHSRQILEQIGTFSYIRDTRYNNTDFGDLLFSIMDSPVYFLQSLLGFELLGVNLFIAFTSLLTLVVILVLIRKFF